MERADHLPAQNRVRRRGQELWDPGRAAGWITQRNSRSSQRNSRALGESERSYGPGQSKTEKSPSRGGARHAAIGEAAARFIIEPTPGRLTEIALRFSLTAA